MKLVPLSVHVRAADTWLVAFHHAPGQLFARTLHGAGVIGLAAFYVGYAAWRVAFKRAVVHYDSQKVSQIFTFRGIPEPFLHSNIASAMVISEYTLQLKFVTPVPFVQLPEAKRPSNVPYIPPAAELPFSGNEDDLGAFIATLRAAGVPIASDPIADDEPLKQSAILCLAIVAIVGSVIAAIFACVVFKRG